MILLTLAAGVSFSSGCGQSVPLSPTGADLTVAVYAATSLQNEERLNAVTTLIRKHRTVLSNAEYDQLSEICELARSGQWTEARDASRRLMRE
ncbi:MAG: hypothetical protein KDA81_07520 [Planctomycetaceae bacterium]|nr:hypothetical protein [Planctomycetaceae bacterium]